MRRDSASTLGLACDGRSGQLPKSTGGLRGSRQVTCIRITCMNSKLEPIAASSLQDLHLGRRWLPQRLFLRPSPGTPGYALGMRVRPVDGIQWPLRCGASISSPRSIPQGLAETDARGLAAASPGGWTVLDCDEIDSRVPPEPKSRLLAPTCHAVPRRGGDAMCRRVFA